MNRITPVGTVVFALTCNVAGWQALASAPHATTDTGVVEGVRDAPTGVTIFRGIPYAAPPAGEWRWRPPQPAAKWSGIRQAKEHGSICTPGGMGRAGQGGAAPRRDSALMAARPERSTARAVAHQFDPSIARAPGDGVVGLARPAFTEPGG
jgi:hypothetical protein